MRYILLMLCFTAFAVNPVNAANTPDHRICDGDGHCLDIAADGSVYASTTNDGEGVIAGAHDIRISDGSGDVLDINADGSITVTE